MFTLPEIRVGASIHHESLTIFPLFAETNGGVEYQLSDEAIGAGTVSVEEIDESGSVPHLHVENKGDARVLFIEGEELRGAKQNRVLNTSVLIAAHSKTTIPVSCVEQGRWGYRSRQFGSGGSHSSPKLRAVLKKSVSDSLELGHGFTSDQGEVWKEVSRQMNYHGRSSPTHAMADTYESYRPRMDEFQARLKYVEGALGLAVAVGPNVVAVDLFDKPSTCRKAWDRLLTGFVMEALEGKEGDKSATAADVEGLLSRLRDAPMARGARRGGGRRVPRRRGTRDPCLGPYVRRRRRSRQRRRRSLASDTSRAERPSFDCRMTQHI